MYGAADTIGMDDEADVPDEMRARRISGLDSREVSAALVNSRALLLKKFLERGRVSEEHSLASIAAMPQLRMIRRICGALTLDENDREVFPDSVGMTGDWRKRGPVFEIPYRSLYSPRISNLIACGRCISVTDAMWDVTRVIPPSALTGEAAGTAASFGGDLRHIDIAKLQSRLRAGGVRLHISEIFS